MSIRLFFEIALFATIGLLLFILWRTSKGQQFIGLNNFAQSVFHTVAAVGIAVTGLWYVLQEDWAPKMSIDVKANAALIPSKAPASAVLQIAVSMKNEGRVPHRIQGITMVARAFDEANGIPDHYGDLAQRIISQHKNNNKFKIMPGETDFAYSELLIPCSEKLVQVFVDVAEPKHLTSSDRKPLSYERKLMVPMDAACQPAMPSRSA